DYLRAAEQQNSQTSLKARPSLRATLRRYAQYDSRTKAASLYGLLRCKLHRLPPTKEAAPETAASSQIYVVRTFNHLLFTFQSNSKKIESGLWETHEVALVTIQSQPQKLLSKYSLKEKKS